MDKKDTIKLIKKDFPMVDLSFLKDTDSISYKAFDNKNSFCDYFFNKVESEGLSKSIFYLYGMNNLKLATKSVTGKVLIVVVDNRQSSTTEGVKSYRVISNI